MLKCNSCGTDVLAKSNFVQFLCPNCGDELIIRCSTCKALSTKYVCKSCKFTGP